MSNIPLAHGIVPPDNDLKVVEAAMRTTSAPTYFPMHHGTLLRPLLVTHLHPHLGYADGALVAQNPSLAAVGRAYAHFPLVTPENTMVLSIGNGTTQKEISAAVGQRTLDWGLQQWAPKVSARSCFCFFCC